MPESRPRASRKEVAEAVRQIRELHRKGRESLAALPGRGRQGQQDIRAQAERLRRLQPDMRWSEAKLRLARQFADPAVGYTREQLDGLCRLLRQHRAHFSTSHVGILLAAPATRRAELQRACLEEDWGTMELDAEVKARFGRRRPAGRKRRVAADPVLALVQLDAMLDTLLRWHAVAAEAKPGGGRKKKSVLDALPEGVRDRVRRLSRSLRRLREDVKAALEEARARRRSGRG
jgi:hypothetical protein